MYKLSVVFQYFKCTVYIVHVHVRHRVLCSSNNYFFKAIVIVIDDCECSVIVLVIVIDRK